MSTSRERTDAPSTTIPLGPALARSARFRTLYADGMRLVEEAATYLDGIGREDARALSPVLADAYSAESMRLTSRLMQIASWLLVRRAVADGEMSPADALQDRVKVTLAAQGRATSPTIFLRLPLPLQRLTEKSLRLQRRVIHLDRMVNHTDSDTALPPQGLAEQYARLRAVYGPET